MGAQIFILSAAETKVSINTYKTLQMYEYDANGNKIWNVDEKNVIGY